MRTPAEIGLSVADRFFRLRSKRTDKRKHAEVHLSEEQLAAVIALGIETALTERAKGGGR